MILAMTVLGLGIFISEWDHVDLLKGAVEMRFLHTTFRLYITYTLRSALLV